jgi:hypothetical protein
MEQEGKNKVSSGGNISKVVLFVSLA